MNDKPLRVVHPEPKAGAADRSRADGSANARRTGDNNQEELSADAQQWLAALPENVRPKALDVLYPRIANRMAALWSKPSEMEAYFDGLMVDRRGGRMGFPFAVASEIATLWQHYRRKFLNPGGKRDPWDVDPGV